MITPSTQTDVLSEAHQALLTLANIMSHITYTEDREIRQIARMIEAQALDALDEHLPKLRELGVR